MERVTVVVAPRDDVDVNVENSLAGAAAVGLEDVESVGTRGGDNGTGQARQRGGEIGGDFRRQVGQTLVVLLGDEQHVTRLDGINVHKGELRRVLIDLRRRDFSRHNPAEDAVSHDTELQCAIEPERGNAGTGSCRAQFGYRPDTEI